MSSDTPIRDALLLESIEAARKIQAVVALHTYSKAVHKVGDLERKLSRYRETLVAFKARGCEKYRFPFDCRSRIPDGEWCAPCVASAALSEAEGSP